MMIQRYKSRWRGLEAEDPDWHYASDDGMWCMAEDVVKLEAENERLKASVEEECCKVQRIGQERSHLRALVKEAMEETRIWVHCDYENGCLYCGEAYGHAADCKAVAAMENG